MHRYVYHKGKGKWQAKTKKEQQKKIIIIFFSTETERSTINTKYSQATAKT